MSEFTLHLNAMLFSGAIVTICVVLHYEALKFLSHTIGVHVHNRIGVLIVMLGLLIAHLLEIIIFAAGYMLLQEVFRIGTDHQFESGQLSGLHLLFIGCLYHCRLWRSLPDRHRPHTQCRGRPDRTCP